MVNTHEDVLFSEIDGQRGNLGVITLNRPHVLNSLNANMIHAMFVQLQIWAKVSSIKAVLIKAAEGRAFCAGGDLKLTYENHQTHREAVLAFFREEYQLNRLIFHYPKPYIALLDGITMGGGVGISIHGSHRVGTNRIVFAMPETGIGFFPDVGGSYFLPRLPQYVGFYLGLLGIRLSIDDCVALGIVQNQISVDAIPDLISALAENNFNHNPYETVTNIIASFNLSIKTPPLFTHQDEIEKCFSKKTIEEIVDALRNSTSTISQEALQLLDKKSPMSLKVTLSALQRGRNLNFDACMQQEYQLASHFISGHDFREGIRSVIIDKDQSPNWIPKTLAAITPQSVSNYFIPVLNELPSLDMY